MKKSLFAVLATSALLAACQGTTGSVTDVDVDADVASSAAMMDDSSSSMEAMMDASSSSSSSSVDAMEVMSSASSM